MSILRRDTGDWAYDLGQGLHELMLLGLVALFVIPILVTIIILLVVFR